MVLYRANHTRSSGLASVRPLRQTVSIRCVTAETDIEGVVRVLSVSHAVDLMPEMKVDVDGNNNFPFFSIEKREALMSYIDKNPFTQTHTLQSLTYGKNFVVPPATQSTFREYYPWNGLYAQSLADYGTGPDGNHDLNDRTAAARLFAEYAAKAPCNNFMFALQEYTKIMTLVITYHYQDAVRAYDPEGITQSFSRQGAVIKNGHFNQLVQYANMRSATRKSGGITAAQPGRIGAQIHGITGAQPGGIGAQIPPSHGAQTDYVSINTRPHAFQRDARRHSQASTIPFSQSHLYHDPMTVSTTSVGHMLWSSTAPTSHGLVKALSVELLKRQFQQHFS